MFGLLELPPVGEDLSNGEAYVVDRNVTRARLGSDFRTPVSVSSARRCDVPREKRVRYLSSIAINLSVSYCGHERTRVLAECNASLRHHISAIKNQPLHLRHNTAMLRLPAVSIRLLSNAVDPANA